MLETTRRERDLDSLAIMESLVQSNKTLQIDKLKLQLKVSNYEIKLAEKVEDISEMSGKISIYKNNQNILMELMNIPQENRHFIALREQLEYLKEAYIEEKERADCLASHV